MTNIQVSPAVCLTVHHQSLGDLTGLEPFGEIRGNQVVEEDGVQIREDGVHPS